MWSAEWDREKFKCVWVGGSEALPTSRMLQWAQCRTFDKIMMVLLSIVSQVRESSPKGTIASQQRCFCPLLMSFPCFNSRKS